MRSLEVDEGTVCKRLYQASHILLGLLSCSNDMGSICLAFCDGAVLIARALRMRRCLSNWGVRVNTLAAAACLARIDDNACELLLSQGLFATIEHCLFVCCLPVPDLIRW
jgi:hypothetical protein